MSSSSKFSFRTTDLSGEDSLEVDGDDDDEDDEEEEDDDEDDDDEEDCFVFCKLDEDDDEIFLIGVVGDELEE